MPIPTLPAIEHLQGECETDAQRLALLTHYLHNQSEWDNHVLPALRRAALSADTPTGQPEPYDFAEKRKMKGNGFGFVDLDGDDFQNHIAA